MRNADYSQSFVYIEDLHIVGLISMIICRTVFYKNGTSLSMNELFMKNAEIKGLFELVKHDSISSL